APGGSGIFPLALGGPAQGPQAGEQIRNPGILATTIWPPHVRPRTRPPRFFVFAPPPLEHNALARRALGGPEGLRGGRKAPAGARAGRAPRLASVHADAELAGGRAADHRERRGQLPARRPREPLLRRRLFPLGSGARPSKAANRRSGAGTARPRGPLHL